MDSVRLAETLYAIHDYFNGRFFDHSLPRPVFTFSAEGRDRFGHFCPGKWMDIEEDGGTIRKQTSLARKKTGMMSDDLPDEINMHSERGLARPIEEVMATVYHEMCHQAQYRDPIVYGKPGKNNYHNKAWHVCCQRTGLETEGAKGYTTVTSTFREIIKDYVAPHDWIARIPSGRNVQPTRMKLWECDCPSKMRKIRATYELDITCNVCHSVFVKIDGG